MSDIYELRRQLKRLHDELRNEGLNPLEALGALAERITHLAGIRYDGGGAQTDLVAAVYQEILSPEARNGLGQYLTPLVVADLMAEIVCADISPDIALDPFCGVGMLLDRVGAIRPDARLLGIEINEPVAGMASALSDFGSSRIEVSVADAFSMFANDEVPTADIVVANPPFGAVVSELHREHPRIPSSLRRLTNIPAELLGLEVCVESLSAGGRLAIVLPQSILTNRRWNEYRLDLARRIRIDAALSLPEATFGPFKGVANACVLFGTRDDSPSTPYFHLYTSKSVGYTASGRATNDSDLAEVAAQIVGRVETGRQVHLTADGAAHIESQYSVGTDGVRLGDIAEVFVGKNPPRSNYAESGPWLLKVGDLAGSAIAWRSRPRNRVDQDWYQKYEKVHLRSGDVCMTSAGHRPKYIGLKVDLVDELPPEGAMPSGEVMVIRLREDSPLPPEVILFFFRSDRGYTLIQDLVRGSTGHLYARDLADLRIPPLDDMYQSSTIDSYRAAIRHFREYRRLETRALFEADILDRNDP